MAAMTNLNIPTSDATVRVRIINTGARLHLPLSGFMEPPIEGHTHLDAPAYSFLIEHPEHGKILFDLSIRKDWQNLAPGIANTVDGTNVFIEVEKDVLDVLEEHGISGSEIKSVIPSHWHCDHIGDITRFPASTSLVLPHGVLDSLTPAYPVNPNSIFLESDYQNRHITTLDFPTHPHRLRLGPFDAIDYFADGSLYLLSTPGHALGHLAALARTTPDTFLLAAGDTAHHSAELRPSPYLPLPARFVLPPALSGGSVCLGAVVEAGAEPKAEPQAEPMGEEEAEGQPRTEPFYRLAETGYPGFEREVAQRTAGEVARFDGDERVLVVIAHDAKVADVVDFFPREANGWMEKGWKGRELWGFLGDLGVRIEE